MGYPDRFTEIQMGRALRFSAITPAPGIDPSASLLASTMDGNLVNLSAVFRRFTRELPDLEFFASDPCRCGMPNCTGLDYGVFGYLDGWVDAAVVGHGDRYYLLRYDPEDVRVSWHGGRPALARKAAIGP